MIRFVALMFWCGLLLASMSVAQVTYISHTRTIQASSGAPGDPVMASAPNFGAWDQTVSSSGPLGSASASQQSTLGSWSASLSLSASASGDASSASGCNFQFIPAVAMRAQVTASGSGRLTNFSLSGPGVALSEEMFDGQSNWNRSVVLQAGQTYTVTSFTGKEETSSSGLLNLTLSFAVEPVPQGRGFTYQGVVRDATGQPISTATDMEFRLFLHPTLAPAQIGPTLTAGAVVPENGVFTRTLDFGDVFNGGSLWLEVSVRNPAGSGTFTPVLPRTPIASVPYASHALRASTATHASSADTASSATNATSAAVAANAISAPWSGLTGQAGVTTGSIGGGWQFLFNNSSVANFRGGARLADNGFLEITNSAQLANPNFARLSSAGAWSAVSDARLKTDVTREDPAALLDAALHLNPVRFVWKATGAADSGLLAQEVRTVAPELVAGSEEGGLLTVDYSRVGVIAVGAVQAQQAEIRRLRERVSKAEAENADLRARLERLEAKVK